jgi:hypothetical protein
MHKIRKSAEQNLVDFITGLLAGVASGSADICLITIQTVVPDKLDNSTDDAAEDCQFRLYLKFGINDGEKLLPDKKRTYLKEVFQGNKSRSSPL